MKIDGKEVCTCGCHQVGRMVMHCMPCCDLCEIKYIRENGEIDLERYKFALKQESK